MFARELAGTVSTKHYAHDPRLCWHIYQWKCVDVLDAYYWEMICNEYLDIKSYAVFSWNIQGVMSIGNGYVTASCINKEVMLVVICQNSNLSYCKLFKMQIIQNY